MPLVVYAPGVNARTSTSVLFTAVDRKNWVYQPNMTRQRHRNRGPRESLKVNQEISQTIYDIKALRKRITDANERMDEVVDTINDGGAVGEVFFREYPAANIDMILLGLEELYARAESVRNRVSRLEG